MTDFDSISNIYRAALPAGHMVDLPLAGIDRIGVPFWVLTFYPDDGPTNAGSGYGLTDAESHMGAFGELTEVVSANMALRTMPREYGSYSQMVARYGSTAVADPLTLCLEAGSDYTPDKPLHWVTAQRYGTEQTVLVPLDFVACQPSDVGPGDGLITPITNGLGAGLSYDGAVAHGLLELVQRDGNSVAFRALAGDLAVELDDVQDERTMALIKHLDQQGVDVVVKLAATDFGMVNVYVVGIDREQHEQAPIMALACGEAAHPDRKRALRKALLEFAAARSRIGFSHGPLAPVEAVTPPDYLPAYIERYDSAGEEQRALVSMQALYPLSLTQMRALLEARILSARRTVPFSSLPTVEGAQVEDRDALAQLVSERLRAEGFDILVVDFSQPNSEVRAVKVIVPGLEVETMSYHRIGLRNVRRLMAQPERLAGVGDPPASAKPVLLTKAAQAELGGPAWLDIAALDQVVGPLYAIYREPGRHAVALMAENRLTALSEQET